MDILTVPTRCFPLLYIIKPIPNQWCSARGYQPARGRCRRRGSGGDDDGGARRGVGRCAGGGGAGDGGGCPCPGLLRAGMEGLEVASARECRRIADCGGAPPDSLAGRGTAGRMPRWRRRARGLEVVPARGREGAGMERCARGFPRPRRRGTAGRMRLRRRRQRQPGMERKVKDDTVTDTNLFPNTTHKANYHCTHREKPVIPPYYRCVVLCTVKNLFPKIAWLNSDISQKPILPSHFVSAILLHSANEFCGYQQSCPTSNSRYMWLFSCK
jgi:hypothetical protein